jgi:hypothetical protein
MILPKRLTRPIQERLVREAEGRVRAEVARLGALQLEIQRLEARYEDQLARHAVADGHPRPARGSRARLYPVGDGGPPPLDVGSVTFEELRDLGLSVTEATRFLAARYRGEVTRVADLNRVAGLSRGIRATLERRLRD